MEHEEAVPGVTFQVLQADKLPPVSKKHKARGKVVLSAEINDFDRWDEVIDKLNGIRIYMVENLAEEMVAVAQKRAHEKEESLEKDLVKVRSELEVLRQKISFVEAEREAAYRTITTQNQELSRLRKVAKELEELEEEAAIYSFESDLGD